LAALRLVLVLGFYAGRNGECWPARKTLARDCGSSVGRISRLITRLVELGYIERHRYAYGSFNAYRVLFDPPAVAADREGAP
jgi:hypothetical protein